MNTPLLLTSVALLAGVAARPIENDGRGDDMRELVRSPDHDNQQALLGGVPTTFGPSSSFQLHDIHDDTHAEGDRDGSTSPKLTATNSPSDPDPGLDSPYLGPQRHLASIEQELSAPMSPIPAPSTSAQTAETDGPQSLNGDKVVEYSPMVVPLVFACLAALVLLGLAVAVASVGQVLQHTIFDREVWRQVTKAKGDASWSEKEKILEDCEDQRVVAVREVPSGEVSMLPPQRPANAVVDDPSLNNSEDISPPSNSVARGQNPDRSLNLAIAAWMYDHWITQFMVALFAWLNIFMGGPRADRRQ